MSPAELSTVLDETVAARCARDRFRGLGALAILVALVVVSCGSDETAPTPRSPALTTPASGQILDNGCAGCSDPIKWEFRWEDIPDATQYHLYVIAEGATIPVIDQKAIPFNQYSYSSQGYAVPGKRTWRVQVLVKGKWSGWGETRAFEVEPSCQDCGPTSSR